MTSNSLIANYNKLWVKRPTRQCCWVLYLIWNRGVKNPNLIEPKQPPHCQLKVPGSIYRRCCTSVLAGCFVSGLFLEGADWDMEHGCLVKSKPRVLVVELPILKIIPMEAHRLRLQVPSSRGTMADGLLHCLWFHSSAADSAFPSFPLSTGSCSLSLALQYTAEHISLC